MSKAVERSLGKRGSLTEISRNELRARSVKHIEFDREVLVPIFWLLKSALSMDLKHPISIQHMTSESSSYKASMYCLVNRAQAMETLQEATNLASEHIPKHCWVQSIAAWGMGYFTSASPKFEDIPEEELTWYLSCATGC